MTTTPRHTLGFVSRWWAATNQPDEGTMVEIPTHAKEALVENVENERNAKDPTKFSTGTSCKVKKLNNWDESPFLHTMIQYGPDGPADHANCA